MGEKNLTDEESEIEPEAAELEMEEVEEKLEDKLLKFREQLKECEKQKGEYLAGWQRAKADFIKARKDEEKNREQIIGFQKENMLRQFLVVADAFELAFKDEGWAGIDEKWKIGVERIYASLVKIFENFNIKSFKSAGEKFNPEKHEAIATEETEEKEKDQMILEELQKGYNINDKILRPAKVKVGIYKSPN